MQDDQEKFKQDRIDERLIYNGRLVEDGISSEFWQEIVGPELHRMISGTTGYQLESGKWVTGEWSKPTTTNDNAKYLAGYVKALQDFSNNLLAFVDAKERAVKRRDSNNETDEPYQYPMMEEYDEPDA